jgi:hypothetical protein
MSKSLIQTVNPSTQAVAVDGIIPLGSVLRRYGCNCRLSGNAIELVGCGYYTVDAAVTVEPTAEGNVTVALYADGSQIPAAIGYGNVAAASPVTVPITTTIRLREDGTTSLTFVLTEGEGNVTNVSVRVEKS